METAIEAAVETAIMKTPAPRPGGKVRYNEIDVFRGLSVCLMAATHGLFWIYLRPQWTYAVSNTGVFFCYIMFLLSFGMSMAIVCQRGNLDIASGRIKTLKRAGNTLLAYYAIVMGYALVVLLITRNTHGLAGTLLGYLVLFDVPKAGDFIVSFVLFQVMAVLLGRRLRVILGRPWLVAGFAACCWLISATLHNTPVSPQLMPYWLLIFGSEYTSRNFPILGYMPLFAASLLLGKAYLAAPDRRRWLEQTLRLSLLLSVLALPGDWFYAHAEYGFLTMLDPVPTLFFLFSGGAMTTALFCLCGLYCLRPSRKENAPLDAFLTYVGQNSIWIIVWQYSWIQALLRVFHVANFTSLPIILYVIAVALLPPVTLYFAQRVWRGRAASGQNDRAVKPI